MRNVLASMHHVLCLQVFSLFEMFHNLFFAYMFAVHWVVYRKGRCMLETDSPAVGTIVQRALSAVSYG